jgi:hypothetical protein
VSPSDGVQGDHVNSPTPLRRKASLPDLQNTDKSSILLQGANYDVCELVKTAVCSPTVITAISAAIVPSIISSLKQYFEPLNTKIDLQNQEIAILHSKMGTYEKSIKHLEIENINLRKDLSEAKDQLEIIEREHDNLEQYSRRTSLRFHRVPVSGDLKSLNTDEEIVNICNNKMSVIPPISAEDIERSHLLGSVRDGKAQIICKFKSWKCKNNVFMCKKNLKHHKSDSFNVFITEDLTKKRQFIVQQLNIARKNDKIESFWTTDGKICYKEKSNNSQKGLKKMINTIDEIEHLLPDPLTEMTEDPWKNLPQ